MLDVAIDMHLIPCHSKKLGSDLGGGKSKGGINRFETYITAQCVNPKSRIILTGSGSLISMQGGSLTAHGYGMHAFKSGRRHCRDVIRN